MRDLDLTYYSDAEDREEELLQKVARMGEEILKLQKEKEVLFIEVTKLRNSMDLIKDCAADSI